MKCRYRFDVTSTLRLEESHPITVDGVQFRLVCDELGVVCAIEAAVSVADPAAWPRATGRPRPGVALDIKWSSPRLETIEHHLRVMEGLLSLYGLRAIDMRSMKQDWEAETDDERAELDIFGLHRRVERTPPGEYSVVPFQFVAASVLAAPKAGGTRIPLSFYRKGTTDFIERRYIEAIYDFYFMLETLFARGKSKNYHVKEEFKRSPALLAAIRHVLSDERCWFSNEPDGVGPVARELRSRYAGRSPEDVVDDIVDLRGFLHHHNEKRPGMWEPDDHRRYEAEAFLLMSVAQEIAFDLTKPSVLSDETKRECARQLNRTLA